MRDSVPIGSICSLQNGRAFKPEEWSDAGTPIIRIQNLNDESKPFNYCSFEVEPRFHINTGDLLFSWSGTPGTSFGAFFWKRGKGFLNQHIFRVDVDESRISKDYLRQALNAQLPLIMGQAHGGVGLQHITKGKLESVEIRLPPLPEQRRIAAILDQADALRAKRREALAQLDSLTQSIFIEMFGAALQSAIRRPLGSLVEEFRYGTSNKSGEGGYPALRIPNVVGGAIDLTELKTVSVDANEFSRLKLLDGDLLFVRTNGNQDYVGRSTVFSRKKVATSGFDAESFIYASYLIRARLKPRSILPAVLQFFLSIEEGRRELRSYSKTSAGQFNINTEGLGAVLIPDFPMALQESFVEKLAAIEHQKAGQKAFGEELDALLASLQHRAFRGEL